MQAILEFSQVSLFRFESNAPRHYHPLASLMLKLKIENGGETEILIWKLCKPKNSPTLVIIPMNSCFFGGLFSKVYSVSFFGGFIGVKS